MTALDMADRSQAKAFGDGAVRRFSLPHGHINGAGIRGVRNILRVDPDDSNRTRAVSISCTVNLG